VKARRRSWKPRSQGDVGRQAGRGYHSDKVFALSNLSRKSRTRASALKQLADRVLEAPDLDSLAAVLTRALPEALKVSGATLLLWDRKLDSFEALIPGETRKRPLRPGDGAVPAPDARYLISDGQLLETPGGTGEGVLLPLMARSGLVGMVVLGAQRRRAMPYRPSDVRSLSVLAQRAALALENTLYQHELIESERMAALGTMASMLAHDFRGPMTVIRGYAESLAEGAAFGAEVKDRARLIMNAVDRLQRMTSETLDFARSGGGQVARRSIVLPQGLEDLASEIAQELPGLTIVREFELPETAVRLDVDKLRRAIGNIAANARDAMKGQGRFHFGARLRDGALVVDLADEGPGVPASIRETVFDPFVTQGKKGGTGLGLAVARRFVQDHGGTLELLPEAEAPGDPQGARFRIRLPLG
jgi:signal transduction histidine kinase